jgi:hypothetical protein
MQAPSNTNEVIVSERKEEIIKEAKRIEESTLYSFKGHHAAAAFWQRMHFVLGIPATILAAVAAASASSQFDEQHFIRGGISIIVAVLSGLTTFFNANKRAGSHLDAANKYESLHSEARIFWTIDCRGTASEQVLTTRLKDLSHTKSQLNRQSPQIPGFAYRIAKNGILAGEADYIVDKPVS